MTDLKQDKLNSKNIFSIAVGDYFEKEPEAVQLVYSPFTEMTFVAQPEFVEQLNNSVLDTDQADQNTKALLQKIIPEKTPEEYLEPNVLKKGFNTLLILPNNICNFSCSYCYSAKGRSGKKLTKETISTALEDFISPKNITEKKCYISILGGGEPLMSWDLIRHTLDYGNQLAKEQDYYIWFSLVTNGSVLTDEMIETFKNHNIRLAFSFEILEEIQNLQRGYYSDVHKNLLRVIDEKIPVRIRSTITKENVHLQEEMIQTVIDRYPQVKTIILEEVTDEDYFDSPEKLHGFYAEFLTNFSKAFELGKSHGKNIECSTFRNNNLFIDRFCPGVLCLTPEGTYSSCSRISSPDDKGYDESIWGSVKNGKVELDKNRLEELIKGYDVYSNPVCENCFAKWHCGGGCYAHKFIYSEDTIDVICDYKRAYTKDRLLKDLDSTYRKKHGVSLKEFVLKQIN